MKKSFRIGVIYISLMVSIQLSAQVDYEPILIKSGYTGGWITNKAKLVHLIPGYTNPDDGRDDFTRYGTYKYLRTDSTGFFYVKKINGRWWMVDPEGYAGINMAVTSFTSSSIQNDYDIIKKNAYNGSGNFLASEGQTKTGYNMQNYVKFSFTRRLNFFSSYKNERKNYYDTPSNVQGSSSHILVLDPKFAEYCDNLASSNVTPYVEERDLLGYFTDNEINFNQDQLRNLVKDLPEGDPSREAALNFATSKGLTAEDCIKYTSKVTEDIKTEFAALLAEHYYKTVSEAIRKYDQNHLILGSRLHGRPRFIPAVVQASHRYMDVTSVNFYDRYSPADAISLEEWTGDHPCLVTEFYVKDISVFNTSQPGAGWYVNSQASRGHFYQNTCLELLQNKCYIGWHYFRFQDDPDSNKGIVSYNDKKEYTEMTAYMKQLNEQVYRLCDFYDEKDNRPQNKATDIQTFTAVEDTWVSLGSSNTSNYGSDAELEVCYNAAEINRREAYFKFDLSSVKDKLPYLKHAEFEVTCTSGDIAGRSLFASGIEDMSWDEFTLNGNIRSTNDDWKNGYNRLDFVKSPIVATCYSFNVTNWIFDHSGEDKMSFKLHELVSATNALKFASKENANENYRPKLVLTFWESASKIVTPNSKKEPYSISLNQTSGILNIDGDPPFQAKIFTSFGQIVLNTQKNENNFSNFEPGVYIVKINLENGLTQTSKILKQ